MKNIRIAIGSDHGGFKLKQIILEFLNDKNIEFEDFGTYNVESCDYPDYAKIVAKEVVSNENTKGILVCGTGIGISIAANKHKGIRAAVCSDTYSAKMSRAHNDANILCLGERVVGAGLALDIIEIWLNTNFEGRRHKNRVDKIENCEE